MTTASKKKAKGIEYEEKDNEKPTKADFVRRFSTYFVKGLQNDEKGCGTAWWVLYEQTNSKSNPGHFLNYVECVMRLYRKVRSSKL